MAYKLSTTKSGISKKWEDQKFLMIGQGGIGKSKFWSYADDVMYIQTEAGLNFIEAIKNPVYCWEDLKDVLIELMKLRDAKQFPFKAVVLDTVDRALEYVETEVMAWARGKYSKGNEYGGIGDIPEGAGWYRRETMMNKILASLESLPCAKVIIGHLDNKEIKQEGEKAFTKSTISIGGKVGGNIAHWSDHTLHIVGQMRGDKLTRIVYTKPTQSREAKSRGSVVKDGWIWSDNDEENFKKLREQFE